jgi:addiction module HigA family antidote
MTHEHPGVFLRQVLKGRRLTVTSASRVLGVTRPALSRVLNGSASLSPEMALRMETAWGIRMELLLERQLRFDIARVRAAAKGGAR